MQYISNDCQEIHKITRDYIKVKLAGDLFYQMLIVNERVGKLEKTFKTKFDKWCNSIESDLKQKSTKIKLTNKEWAVFKEYFKKMNMEKVG